MNRVQRLTQKIAENLSRVHELTDPEPALLTEEQTTELRSLKASSKDLNEKLSAAIEAGEGATVTETDGDAEATEPRSLIGRGSVGRIMHSVVETRSIDGAEAELQKHFKLGRNQVPLAMLRMTETRAVTPPPANVSHRPVQGNQSEILAPVFATGDASFLGVPMPTVAPGQAVYPVLSSRPSVRGPHSDSTSAADTTGSFTAAVLAPNRIQAAFFFRRTDAAQFPGMDDALRAALSEGLSEKLDNQLMTQILADVTRTDASAVDSVASYKSRLVYSQIDGRNATAEGQVRMLIGSGTLAHMGGVYRGTQGDVGALDAVRGISGGVRVSAHIAGVSGNKQDAIVRRGATADSVIPLWDGVTIIPDEITKAATGEILISAVLMANWKILRTDGWARVETQHA